MTHHQLAKSSIMLLASAREDQTAVEVLQYRRVHNKKSKATAGRLEPRRGREPPFNHHALGLEDVFLGEKEVAEAEA